VQFRPVVIVIVVFVVAVDEEVGDVSSTKQKK